MKKIFGSTYMKFTKMDIYSFFFFAEQMDSYSSALFCIMSNTPLVILFEQITQ